MEKNGISPEQPHLYTHAQNRITEKKKLNINKCNGNQFGFAL